MNRQTILTGLICFALFALPAPASATVFQNNGSRDATPFTGFGPVQAEGTGGAGKYVWFVDRLADEDILRGFDQSDPLSPVQLATIDGSDDVGPGKIGRVSALAFSTTLNNLYITDLGNNQITVYPRANDQSPNDPVSYMNAFSVNNFNPGFSISEPKGIAIDTTGNNYGYASVKNGNGQRGLLVFNPTPSGPSLSWLKFVWDPSSWNSTNGPGQMTLDPVTGDLYVAIDGLSKIKGYTPFIENRAGEFFSSSSGDFKSLAVDNESNRLFGAKSDSTEVFSLKTSQLLGVVNDPPFSQNASLATLPSSGKFFLASLGAPYLRDLVVNPIPTCTPSDALEVVSGEVLTFIPNCTDSDGSTTLEFEVTSAPEIGSAQVSNTYGAIDYSAYPDALGSDELSYRVTTQNGRSITYQQPISVISPDETAPVVNITAPSAEATLDVSPTTLRFTVSDNRDSSPECDYADEQQIPLDEGRNAITVSCVDDSGNIGQNSVSFTYLPPDTTAPEVAITAPVDGAVVGAPSVNLGFTVTDDRDESPSCSRANGDEISLVPGANVISVDCYDGAENAGSDEVTVNYDEKAPVVEITSPISGTVTTNSTATLEYTVSDNYASAPTCDIANGAEVDLEVGDNLISVECQDSVGNKGSAVTTVTFDAAPPRVEITEPVDRALVTSPTATVNFSVSDDADNEPSCDTSSGASLPLTAGPNTIVVSCTDQAGRIGSDSATVTFDAAPPQIEITAPTDGARTSSNQTVLRYSVTDDTDESPDCTRTDGATIQLVPGSNTITVSCTDDAERTAAKSVAVIFEQPVQAAAAGAEPFIRKTANLEPTAGEVLVKLPGSDKYIPLSEALLVPVGTIVDARKGTAKLTLANQDGSTYEAEFWGGIFQVYQGTGDAPIAIMKLRDDLVEEANSSDALPRIDANPFREVQIAKRGKKKNGLWGNGKGKFKTSGAGGSATVRGTKWYVANYEGGTLFRVDRGIVNVRPTHGDCFDLKAGESRFIEYKPLTESQKRKKTRKKAKPKKGCA